MPGCELGESSPGVGASAPGGRRVFHRTRRREVAATARDVYGSDASTVFLLDEIFDCVTEEPTAHVELDDEALKAVANETRLRIVIDLGATVRDGAYGTRRFSELLDAVGVTDSGQLTYHLDKLREQKYVERTDEGYRLTLRGLRIYQFVRSGVLSRTPDIDPLTIGLTHDDCGEPLSIRYEDQRMYGECEACDEIIGVNPVQPSAFDPGDRESMSDAYRQRFWMDNFAMTQGFCPYCGGDVTTRIDYRHTEAVPTESQGEDPAITFTCEVCRWFITTTIEFPGYLHPAVVAFCHERGLDIREHNPVNLPLEFPEYVVHSEDPWRVAVTYAYDGDEITLTFDDDLTVHDVTVGAGNSDDRSRSSTTPDDFSTPAVTSGHMRILLGVGGSDDSLRALERTIDRAREAGDELTVAILDEGGTDRSVDDVEADVRDALDAGGVDAEIRSVEGDPGSELVDIAESEGFDRIALSGGTTSPMGKIQLGSTAEFVLLNSHVSVSLIR